MSDISNALTSLIPIVGDVVIEKAQQEIDDLAAEASDPTKALVFALMADAVETLGPEGIAVAKREVDKLLRGEVADIDWASPRVASDAVAALQNAERAEKKSAQQAVKKAGHLFGTFGVLFFKAAVSGALQR